jgi:hypothetical protein
MRGEYLPGEQGWHVALQSGIVPALSRLPTRQRIRVLTTRPAPPTLHNPRHCRILTHGLCLGLGMPVYPTWHFWESDIIQVGVLELYCVYIPGYMAAIEAQWHRGITLDLTTSLQLITVMSVVACLLRAVAPYTYGSIRLHAVQANHRRRPFESVGALT